jgi:hypothetical protein
MRSARSCFRTRSLSLILAAVIALPLFFSIPSCCPGLSPSLYPVYDVLNPTAEVRKNPLKVNEDGTLIINFSFWQWTDELQQEIKRLRQEIKDLRKK